MVEFCGAEGRKATLGGIKQYRQTDADMVFLSITAFIGHEMELVGIQNVAKYYLVRVEFFGGTLIFSYFALVMDMPGCRFSFLGRNSHAKKAETRYQ
jgi:hypothetical protein